MEEERIDLEQLPVRPPEGMLEKLKNQGCFKQGLFIYQIHYERDPLTGIRQKCVAVKCTECKRETIYPYVSGGEICHMAYQKSEFGFRVDNTSYFHGDAMCCPECRAKGEVIHKSHFRSQRTIQYEYPVSLHEIGGHLAVLSWCIRKICDVDGTILWSGLPYEGYLMREKKMIRLCGYVKFMGAMTLTGEWKALKKYSDEYGELERDKVMLCSEKELEMCEERNCRILSYISGSSKSCYPVTYLKIWQKHRNIEGLIDAGAQDLVSGLIQAHSTQIG